MAKQWTCNDCVVKDTDACYYGNPMFTDFECDKRIVDVDYAYEQGITDAIEVCAKVCSSLVGICKTSCPVDCNWGTDESCIESWKVYLAEQLKEQK